MRENMGLYRGKRIDNGEWAHGFYAQCDEKYDNGCEGHMYREGVATIHYIIDRKGNSVMVDSKTVGQYTGMNDKNGVGIFENDIVNIQYFCNEYHEETRMVMLDGVHGFSPLNWESYCDNCDETTHICEIEIINNIHDNPELLGGE